MNYKLIVVVLAILLITTPLNSAITIPEATLSQVDGSDYISRVQVSGISVRMLILRHSSEGMAHTDANLALRAIKSASSNGLKIRDIGNHLINKDGPVSVSDEYNTSAKLQEFISQQMKIGAESRDTLVIFTIGHGFGGGSLQTLGQRREVMQAFAQAAEENNQETLWWQLSCHATAALPGISELNEKQQGLFSILSACSASETAGVGVQGRHMEKVFVAIANRSTKIDPNQDDVITAKELRDFMESEISRGKGKLVFAKSDDEPIFGLLDLANQIPIIDQDGPQKKYPDRYIPHPSRNI